MKTPDLKLRYSKGLGDIVACVLHSKALGWLTHSITGLDKPCQLCSQRRHAMNFLFPIPLWRLFYKNMEQFVNVLADDYRNLGYKVDVDLTNYSVIFRKEETQIEIDKNLDNHQSLSHPRDYKLISQTGNYSGNYYFNIEIFEKIR